MKFRCCCYNGLVLMATVGTIATPWTVAATGAAFIPASLKNIQPSSSIKPTFTTTGTTETKSSTTVLGMAGSGAMNCRLIGVGSAAPQTVISNVDLENIVETSDEWIKTRTGISQRHVLLQQESARSLGIEAAQKAIEMAGIDPLDIDLVICSTSTPEDMFGDAPSIASAVGCDIHTLAFDLTAACSGFLFATTTAGKYLSTPNSDFKNALVIGADALSRWVDWDDRNTCILFGDGAGAMVLTKDEETQGFMGSSAHSNGGGYDVLKLEFEGEPRKVSTPGEGIVVGSGGYGKIFMEGKEVYKFATREVPKVLEEALENAKISVDEVDWLLLHQANIRIMDVVAKRLNIPLEKIIANLEDYGNTSAASIPIALDEAVRSGKVKKGDVIACAGFGAGLSWGAAILKWG